MFPLKILEDTNQLRYKAFLKKKKKKRAIKHLTIKLIRFNYEKYETFLLCHILSSLMWGYEDPKQ